MTSKRQAQAGVLADMATMRVEDACRRNGRSYRTYESWRATDLEFRAKADYVKRHRRVLNGRPKGKKDKPPFAAFRRHYFKMDTYPHQTEMVRAIESAPDDSVTLILAPPAHGKTSLIEDYVCYKLALEPDFRIVAFSESQDHARKIVANVQRRMTDADEHPEYMADFGPFKPEGRADNRPWNVDEFSVVASSGRERDYSLCARGITSKFLGSRYDLVLLDDVQSPETATMTDKLMNIIQGTLLSRSGRKGRIIVIGTRVGPRDLYSKMLELDGFVDRYIVFSAYDKDGNPCCPEMWPTEALEKKRKKMTADGWAMIYMQQPGSAANAPFTAEMIEGAKDHERGLGRFQTTGEVICALDPGLMDGKCAFMAAALSADRLEICDLEVRTGLARNEDILTEVTAFSARYRPTTWVVEENNFQRGLVYDNRFSEIARQFGFDIVGHRTNRNKLDPTIGVRSMASSLIDRGGGTEIRIPWQTAEARAKMGMLVDQLLTWRPAISGKLLTQDLVMCPLDVETPLWTMAGWKTMGTVEVGDEVATASGSVERVVALTPVTHQPVFKVRFNDNSELRATAEHRWWVSPRTTGSQELPARWMTTEELARHKFKSVMVKNPEPLDLPEADLPLDPYVLGVWLGDGDSRQGTIFQSVEDLPVIRANIELAGYETALHRRSTGFGIHGIRGHLNVLGLLGNKHIPEQYLRASFKQRLALLQGLMDTDGTVGNGPGHYGRCAFGNTNHDLVRGVEFLALSLGYRPSVQYTAPHFGSNPRGDSHWALPFWRVLFRTDSSTPCPFRLPRKIERTQRRMTKTGSSHHINVRSVEPDGEADVCCLTVDHPSHVFLAGERLVPTGNCWFTWITWSDRRGALGVDLPQLWRPSWLVSA